MKSKSIKQGGFTLVEVAIVLLIVTILMGYTVAMFPIQQDLKKYRHVDRELDVIIEHLIAFAQVNGRLPCPDTNNGGSAIDGQEDRSGTDDCNAFFGFLPARTLGMEGDYNAVGSLVDPWGQGYGYAVSDVNTGGGTPRILVTPNGIRDEGMNAVIPDLVICDDSTAGGNETDCATAGGNDVADNVAAVVISLGKDNELPPPSNIQIENTDGFHNGLLDKVYVSAAHRDDYDDEVKWISTNLLFSKMIAAEQLP